MKCSNTVRTQPLWWALPPLQLTARYYSSTVPVPHPACAQARLPVAFGAGLPAAKIVGRFLLAPVGGRVSRNRVVTVGSRDAQVHRQPGSTECEAHDAAQHGRKDPKPGRPPTSGPGCRKLDASCAGSFRVRHARSPCTSCARRWRTHRDASGRERRVHGRPPRRHPGARLLTQIGPIQRIRGTGAASAHRGFGVATGDAGARRRVRLGRGFELVAG